MPKIGTLPLANAEIFPRMRSGAAPARPGRQGRLKGLESSFKLERGWKGLPLAPGGQQAGSNSNKHCAVFGRQLRNYLENFSVFWPMLARHHFRRQEVRDLDVKRPRNSVHPIERQPTITPLQLLNLSLCRSGRFREVCQRHPPFSAKQTNPVLHKTFHKWLERQDFLPSRSNLCASNIINHNSFSWYFKLAGALELKNLSPRLSDCAC
jgi:hypothetical protein